MTDTSPLLLTPGPLTTSEATRRAMLRDWGSRDEAFIALTARVRRCIGQVFEADMRRAVAAIGEALREQGVAEAGRSKAA